MKRIDRELCGYTYGGQRAICSSWLTRLEIRMAVLVLILMIAEILSGFALKEQDSWLMAVRTMKDPMAVYHALRAVVWILSFALVVLVKGRAPP